MKAGERAEGETSRQAKDFQKKKGEIIDGLGGECQECGKTDYLELHHIEGHGKSYRSGAARLRDWRIQAARNNLIVLCYDCHKKVTFKKKHSDITNFEIESRARRGMKGIPGMKGRGQREPMTIYDVEQDE